jgi:SAM-dependent methyltransferase
VSWNELASRWERGRALQWEATSAVGEWLVDRLDPQPGQVVLDLAAGTGDTGFLAAPKLGPAGTLIVGDSSPEMLAAAQRVGAELGVANADFRLLDVERLDLPDASVDGVLSRFGYILRGNGLGEARRVLRPGGRLAFAVWAERERNDWITIPTEVMVERGHLSPPSDAELRLSERRNPASVERLAREAGFERVELAEQAVAYRFADADELWFFVRTLRGPVSLALDELGDDERANVRAELERRVPRAGAGFELGGVAVEVCASQRM